MIEKLNSSKYISYSHQHIYLNNVKKRSNRKVRIFNHELVVFPGVYETDKDTELIAKSVHINKKQSFLELGTGCGAVSIYLSSKCKNGVASDINPQAVRNARYNANKLGINNIKFLSSDLFDNIKGKYDIIVFNPPYSNYKARDLTDKMFWDTNNRVKKKFFKKVNNYLKLNGKIFFGWANFKDLDINLPLRLAKKEGLKVKKCFKQDSGKGFKFIVLEIAKH